MHYLDINGEHLYVEELWRDGDDIHVRTTDGREFTMKNVEIPGFRINGVPGVNMVEAEPGSACHVGDTKKDVVFDPEPTEE